MSQFAALSHVIPLGMRADCSLIHGWCVFYGPIVFWKMGPRARRWAAVVTFEKVLGGTVQSI